MKFDSPARQNPIDRLKVVGKPVERIDGPLKTTGRATYAYEQNEAAPNAVYGVIVGAAIAKGRILSIDKRRALAAPGVLGVFAHDDTGRLGTGAFYAARALAGPEVQHYHQAVAVVVAETFEQATCAAALVDVRYEREAGAFDLAEAMGELPRQQRLHVRPEGDNAEEAFDAAFAAAPVKVDAHYTTPHHAHAMMEPHATIAAWEGDKLTVWTAIQIVHWGARDLARTFNIAADDIRVVSPYIGGGFGGKATTGADAVLAALAAKRVGRPVKVVLQRALMYNNTTHRSATIQHVRLGAGKDGRLSCVGHESWSGDLANRVEDATAPTRLLYAGRHRMMRASGAHLDLAENGMMRAPGEMPGLMALEIAMDELAEKLGMDPVALRVLNDTQVDPGAPGRPFSKRQLVECLRTGAARFGWDKRAARPATVRDGAWLVGMGMAAGVRGSPTLRSGARVRLDKAGIVTVETGMTDLGTGSYTILAQTAAEMLGVPIEQVVVKLGDSTFPVASGSGGQFGAASSTAGVYAACMALRAQIAERLKMDAVDIEFVGGRVRSGGNSRPLRDAVAAGDLTAQDAMEYGTLSQRFAQETFAAHFAEVGVHAATGEIRVRRMLAVCGAGRIINPLMARSQIIGAMTMGVGGALMEELVVDKRGGFFVNHDMAGYEVPVHADIPHLDVVFLDEVDPTIGPLKAKGLGELGIAGVPAAIANAVYNATGVRVRDYPVTLDKLLPHLPSLA
ncbi:aldehyde oxidoreductase molybdenum-binding subunit PaoC [Massilia aurea]|uniref:aldehyde oxidoreductase molybdenum-binding subunit PaoC n=1 Tax=Massilia aurea TaxID=373040 RepID=UPI003461AFAA